MNLADPRKSRAVLVGVSKYDQMPEDRQLPAVASSLERLDELLCDPEIWGLSRKNCIVIQEPKDSETVVGALRQAAAEASDTFLFYYAGHGVTHQFSSGELFLALSGTYEPFGAHTALNYEFVRGELIKAKAQNRVVLLDCCWSGLAVDGRAMGAEQFAAVAAVDRAAVLTASARTKTALSVPGEKFTAFSGALIDLLGGGDPRGPAVFDMGYLYQALETSLRSRGRPLPMLGATRGGEKVAIARNRLAGSAGVLDPRAPEGADRPQSLPSSDATAAHRATALVRVGDYGAASRLRALAAASGEPRAVSELAQQIRRCGDYAFAAQLESLAESPRTNSRMILEELAAHGYVTAESLAEEL